MRAQLYIAHKVDKIRCRFLSARKKLIRDSLHALSTSKDATLQNIHRFQDEKGRLGITAFKENIKDLFPLFIHLVAEHGTQATACRLMGINPYCMANFLHKLKPLRERVHAAQKLKKDKKALEQIELKELLS